MGGKLGGSLCTVHSWRIKAQRQTGRGGATERETAVARWSPICVQVAECCCTGQSARYRVSEREDKYNTQSRQRKQTIVSYLSGQIFCICAAYCGGTLCSSRSERSCSLRELSHLDLGTCRGRWIPCSSVRRDTMQSYRTLRRIWGLDYLPRRCCFSLPNPELETRGNGPSLTAGGERARERAQGGDGELPLSSSGWLPTRVHSAAWVLPILMGRI